jgi:2-dehydropantoate 2-reductase
MLGAGALGSAIGGTLAAAGSEITLVDVFKPHVDAINAHGLRMRTGEGDRIVRAKAAIDARHVGVVDLVIVLVKSFHTREAMQGALSLVGPNTVVMSLQNGLGHEDILADVVGKQHVIAGKTYVGGVFLAPGQVNAGVARKQTLIGELDGTITPRVQTIADEFERAGLSTVVSSNIYGTMWDKLLVNVATGALAGITHLTYGELYAVKEIEACAIAAVEEAMAVAKANGIELSTRDARDAWVKASEGLPGDFKTSMLQSLEKGSVTEIDFINGSVVRWGARKGLRHRDRLHQRLGRAVGRAPQRAHAGQPDARGVHQGHRARSRAS